MAVERDIIPLFRHFVCPEPECDGAQTINELDWRKAKEVSDRPDGPVVWCLDHHRPRRMTQS